MAPMLNEQDRASVAHVSDTLSQAFMTAGNFALTPLASDPRVSPIGLMLGLIQAHLNGLASALAQLDDLPRNRLIASIPAQLSDIIARTAHERG